MDTLSLQTANRPASVLGTAATVEHAAGPLLRWLIVIGSVSYLAIEMQQTLGGVAWLRTHEQAVTSLQFLGVRTEAAFSPPSRLWLDRVFVDGRLLRWNAAESLDHWAVVEDRGPRLPGILQMQSGETSARLTFRGVPWVVTGRAQHWNGEIRTVGDALQTRMVGAQRGNNGEERIFLESAVSSSGMLWLVGGGLVLAAAAWSFGPVRLGYHPVWWLLFVLTLVHGMFWVSQCVGTNDDSPAYLESVQYVVKGEPSYFPPGYPLFLGGLAELAPGTLGRWITLVQHGMAVAGGLWLYGLLRRIVTQELALLGGLLGGALAPVLTTAQAVMSECPTGFAMLGALYFAVRSRETDQWFWAALSGLFLGWAGMLRVVPLAAMVPALGLYHLWPLRPDGWRRLGVTAVTAIFVLLLPISWFWYRTGQPTLTTSQGFHLFNRVVTEQKLLDEQAPMTRHLLELLEGRDPRGVSWWDVRDHARVRDLNEEQVERLFRQVALEGIHKDPAAFVFYTGPLAWRMLISPADWIPAWGDTVLAAPSLESPPPLAVTASSLDWRQSLEDAHRGLWPLLCGLAILGILLGVRQRGCPLVLALAWVPVGYLLASAGVEYFSPRYNAAVAPFVAALAVLPPAMLLGMMGGKSAEGGETQP